MKKSHQSCLFLLSFLLFSGSQPQSQPIGALRSGGRVLADLFLGSDVKLQIGQGQSFEIALNATSPFRWMLLQTSQNPLVDCRQNIIVTPRRRSKQEGTTQVFSCWPTGTGDNPMILSMESDEADVASKFARVQLTVVRQNVDLKAIPVYSDSWDDGSDIGDRIQTYVNRLFGGTTGYMETFGGNGQQQNYDPYKKRQEDGNDNHGGRGRRGRNNNNNDDDSYGGDDDENY